MSERMSEERRARIENLLSEGYQTFLRSTVLELTREIDRLQAEVREKDERINVLDFERQTQWCRFSEKVQFLEAEVARLRGLAKEDELAFRRIACRTHDDGRDQGIWSVATTRIAAHDALRAGKDGE